MLVFPVAPQTANVTATVRDKVLMKVVKAFNFWVDDMNRMRVPTEGNMLQQKALSLYEGFQKKDGTKEETKPFRASRGWLHRFRNRSNLKNIKIIGEAVLANEEAAAKFLAELKKINKEGKYDTRQVFNCDETGLFWNIMPKRTYIHKSAKKKCQDLKHGRIK